MFARLDQHPQAFHERTFKLDLPPAKNNAGDLIFTQQNFCGQTQSAGRGGGGLLPSSQIQEVFHQPQSHYIATVSVGRYYFVKENLCLVRQSKSCVRDFLPTVGACSTIRCHRWYFVQFRLCVYLWFGFECLLIFVFALQRVRGHCKKVMSGVQFQ